VTCVPARNTIFLAFALAYAETIGAEAIFISANAVDYSGYPDYRPDFLRAFEEVAGWAPGRASRDSPLDSRSPAPAQQAAIIRRGWHSAGFRNDADML
jgi:7-cyano-7-deazaguanine synthase